MTTKPNMVELVGMFNPVMQTIRQGDWWKVGQQGDGLVYYNKLKGITGMSLQFGVIPKYYIPYNYQSLDGVTDFWVLGGMYTSPSGAQYQIGEWTGNLADRAKNPAPFYDENEDTTLGGPNLNFKIEQALDPANGVTIGALEFYWSKDPQPVIP